jgi:hypothetical protein
MCAAQMEPGAGFGVSRAAKRILEENNVAKNTI